MSLSKSIDLGFAEPFTNEWLSKSKYFPSKIGGHPSFLVLNPILGYDQLNCRKCQKTMRFILQLYAPIESNEQAFHRQLFVFGCGRQEQCSNQFLVFRCQLPRTNQFYSHDPPDYDKDSVDYNPNPLKFGQSLCPICGIHANKRCSQCLKISYCSREHQIVHWKKGGHKDKCQQNDQETNDSNNVRYENLVFPEYEIIIDEADETENQPDDQDDVSEMEMKKYQDYVHQNQPSCQNENIEQYLPEDECNEQEQQTFDRFRQAIRRGEIIRYDSYWQQQNLLSKQSFDRILWISNRNRITDVPKCENCGSQRRFEFQIMPNLLNKIQLSKNDHMDWGTLLVFTCSMNCIKIIQLMCWISINQNIFIIKLLVRCCSKRLLLLEFCYS
nr:programmed cell death protein 2-like [Dermatophagoides farinae]XP_046911424.1 programmed cell death protein 2-like [Dermatophagoides farinae]